MATKIFDARLQHKRDRVEQWELLNPVLLDGEMILVEMADGKECYKIGDGTTPYNGLPLYHHAEEKQDKIIGEPGDFVVIGDNGELVAKTISNAEEASF